MKSLKYYRPDKYSDVVKRILVYTHVLIVSKLYKRHERGKCLHKNAALYTTLVEAETTITKPEQKERKSHLCVF